MQKKDKSVEDDKIDKNERVAQLLDIVDRYYAAIRGYDCDDSPRMMGGHLGRGGYPEIQTDKPQQLLKRLGTVSISGTETFVAADHFRPGNNQGVKIVRLDDIFEEHLLGKVETGVGPATLSRYELLQSSSIRSELSELDDKFETLLAHLWALLTRQPKGEEPNGEDRVLLTNGRANIFYMYERAVYASWFSSVDPWLFGGDNWVSDGWCVDVYSVGCRTGCCTDQIFSLDS